MPSALPIDDHLDAVVDGMRRHGAMVLVAPPGSGKTTRVPPALTADGRVVLLQPRRLAARALARRIAVERGWTLGAEVGWQVRFDRRFGKDTRLLVATEGVLTARLQSDPLLEGFRTVVLDEFHERSLHADLALALLGQVREARDDLRILVMSATLDARPVAAFLGGCPVLDVPGSLWPVEVEHAPQLEPAAACRRVMSREGGHVLCFLPGAPEIERTARDLAGTLPGDVDVLPLHGSLDADEQDAALAPRRRRKLILATNLAETSLTVEGVSDVVDTGRHKVMRLDPALGIDRLELERISEDSARQRAGRAGRTGPGRALRLYDPRELPRVHREPEVRRVDLAGPLLEVLAWGDDPLEFGWFERPDEAALGAGLVLLERLGAVRAGRLTPRGSTMRRLPLHPRLARLLLAAGGSAAAAAACAALSEGWTRIEVADACDSDLLRLADRIGEAPWRVRRAAGDLRRLASRVTPAEAGVAATDDERLRRAVLAAYPDRVARRRGSGSDRLLLAGGSGAALAPQSGVRGGEYLVAVELTAGRRGPGSEARVRLASRIEAEWLEPTGREIEHEIDPDSGVVRAFERTRYESIVLSERPTTADPDAAAELLAAWMLERGVGPTGEALLRRLAFAGVEVDVEPMLRAACAGRTAPFAVDLAAWLSPPQRAALERHAPATLPVPSGRQVKLDYRDDGQVVASVKLQELFGLAATPRLGPQRTPVTFSLLAPNGRPVQTTRDLRSFWDRTYAEVRRELRGRYPKHPWPEDPWNAPPTARARRRGKKPES